jgi:hypothetical protein
LAVRGAYALIVSGRLNADRGTAGNDQPDRRTPGQVLEAMRLTIRGVHQLGQALRDFPNDGLIRAVDEDGNVRRLDGGAGDQMVNDIYLRGEFPPDGKARAPRPGATPLDCYHNGISALGTAMEAVDRAFHELAAVVGDDGRPLVEARGVDQRTCTGWRQILERVDDEIVVWARTYKQAMGVAIASQARVAEDGDEPELLEDEADPIERWDAESEERTPA